MTIIDNSCKSAETITSILWFRRDLRLLDNPALDWVCENSDSVLPVYICAKDEHWPLGGASRWWLYHSLQQLQKQLADCGLKLHFFKGNSQQVLSKLISHTAATDLVFNKLYDPAHSLSDSELLADLNIDIRLHSFDSGLFFTPGEVLNKQQLPYRVFTPFYKKLRPLLGRQPETELQSPLPASASSSIQNLKTLASVMIEESSELVTLELDSLGLLEGTDWYSKFHTYWQPGERNASQLLDTFLDISLENYPNDRDFPAIDGTSKLSAHLHFGEITPQQIYSRLWPLLQGGSGSTRMNSAEVYIRQLLWREFAHHILWFFPETAVMPMDKRYQQSFWRYDENDFLRWTRGETGVPIVDAGMKQLWQTGWMHNRVRMIVSSFLTKNLGIHWIYGARWFLDTLVDADLANNTMGWQWVAGCGVDAAPYYRVFNPLRQTMRFDRNFEYIETWLPEHRELDYPAAMVDLDRSRQDALYRYKQSIKS